MDFRSQKKDSRNESYFAEMAREPVAHPLTLREFIRPVEFVNGCGDRETASGFTIPYLLSSLAFGLKIALVDVLAVGPVSQAGKKDRIDRVTDRPDRAVAENKITGY